MKLRSYLMRLVWLCIAPLVVLAACLAYLYVDSGYADREKAAQDLLQNLSKIIDNEIESRITALEILAASKDIDDPQNLAAFYEG